MQLLLQAFDDDSDLKTFANPKIIVSSGKGPAGAPAGSTAMKRYPDGLNKQDAKAVR